jgi:hypothetical protein
MRIRAGSASVALSSGDNFSCAREHESGDQCLGG